LSDGLGSAAALVAGLLILWKGWTVADPLLTMFVAVLIVAFTWRLTRQTLHILLEGVPTNLDLAALARSIASLPHVRDVHDMHAWRLGGGVDSVSAHVVLDQAPKGDAVTHAVHELLEKEFRVHHVTVQVESPDCPCG